MTFLEKLNTIERLHHLIRLKATGNPNVLAAKLGVSRRALFNTIDLIKEMGAPIEYCNYRQCYYYTTDCDLKFGYTASDNTGFKMLKETKGI